MTTTPAPYQPAPLARAGSTGGLILLLLTGLFNLLVGAGLTVFIIYAVAEDGTSDHVISHSDLPTFLAVMIPIALLFFAMGFAEALSSLFVRKGSVGGAILALLTTLLNLLVAVAAITLGVLLVGYNTDKKAAVLTGSILAGISLLVAILLLVQLIMVFRSLRRIRAH